MCIIAFILYRITKKSLYLNNGIKLLNYVKIHQIKSNDKKINGGISGSWPIDGRYNSNEIPNWPSKFFIDALLLERNQDIILKS